MRNRIIDYWRTSTRRQEVSVNDKLAGIFYDDNGNLTNDVKDERVTDPYSSSPDSILIAKENIEKLLEIIQQLPDTSREVIEMFYIKEMTYNEIAEALHTTSNAVGQRIFYAKKQLKQLLTQHH